MREIIDHSKTGSPSDDIGHLCINVVNQSSKDRSDLPPPIQRQRKYRFKPPQHEHDEIEEATQRLQEDGYPSFDHVPSYFHEGFPSDPCVVDSHMLFPSYSFSHESLSFHPSSSNNLYVTENTENDDEE